MKRVVSIFMDSCLFACMHFLIYFCVFVTFGMYVYVLYDIHVCEHAHARGYVFLRKFTIYHDNRSMWAQIHLRSWICRYSHLYYVVKCFLLNTALLYMLYRPHRLTLSNSLSVKPILSPTCLLFLFFYLSISPTTFCALLRSFS